MKTTLESLTIADITMKRFINVVLLILWAPNENDPATIAFRAFRHTSDTSTLHRMIILHSNRDGILST